MSNNQFKTKEEYLQYRKDWKAEYKQLSEDIREKKWMQKELNRAWNKGKQWGEVQEILSQNKRYQTLHEKYKNEHYLIAGLDFYKSLATGMLEELKEAKQEAQRKYLVAKAKLTDSILIAN